MSKLPLFSWAGMPLRAMDFYPGLTDIAMYLGGRLGILRL
jgi:hypothetical protein